MSRCWPWILALVLQVSIAFAQGVGVGSRVDLTDLFRLDRTKGQFAQLFVPDYFHPDADGSYILVFHLHSASWAAEDQVYKARCNAVLCNIHLGALSSPYQSYFSDQSRFAAMLDTVSAQLSSNGVIRLPRLKTLIITSFSAGYAGVREILKNPAYYGHVAALTLADGLHCSEDPTLRAGQMQDFVRFARDAAKGQKVMVLTHSSIRTTGYWSTTQTAAYLVAALGATVVPCGVTDEIGMQYSRCDTGCFHLRGYMGDAAQDHLKHLYAMDKMLAQVMKDLGIASSPVQEGWLPTDQRLGVHVYPNPFRFRTAFRCLLANGGWARLTVFNVLGQRVYETGQIYVPASGLEMFWEAREMPAGVYTYRFESDGKTRKGHCALVR
ncbi:MAG: T9SS type A sorting domain-containing protein [Candidatus Oleimicrobiaceae bacterium]